MVSNKNTQSERDLARMQANREELVERMMRAVPQDGPTAPLEGIRLYRSSVPSEPVYSVAKPALCVIAQGSKEVLVGSSRYRYDPFHYLIATPELPRASRILEASAECPYLTLILDLTPDLVGSVMVEAGPAAAKQPEALAIDVSPLDVNLQDAVVRLVRLIDAPAEAAVLLPLIKREIVFRLLTGTQSARLRHLMAPGENMSLIARAIDRMRREYDQSLRMEDLARELGMSVSGLHHHFKAVTAMSPLQFQKQIRLQEARRLMLSEDLDAASAAFRVGYNDAAHFSREYKSLFGEPPRRDVHRVRGEMMQSPVQWRE